MKYTDPWRARGDKQVAALIGLGIVPWERPTLVSQMQGWLLPAPVSTPHILGRDRHTAIRSGQLNASAEASHHGFAAPNTNNS